MDLSVDTNGKLQAVGKSWETKRAMTDLLDNMTTRWMLVQPSSVVIVHSDEQEQAGQLQQMAVQRSSEAPVYQAQIGPVTDSHIWGQERNGSHKTEQEVSS